jgi:methyl-accepting chemotaxis protein
MTFQTIMRGNSRLLRSVFFKSTLIVALCVAVVSASMAWLNYRSAHASAVSEAIQHGEAVSPMIARQISGALRFGRADQAKELLDSVLADANGKGLGAMLIDIEGKRFAVSMAGGNSEVLQNAAEDALAAGGPFRSADGFTYAIPVTAGEEGIIYGALASTWTPELALAKLREGALINLALTAAIFLTAILAAAIAFHRVIARPLNRVNAAMTRVASKEYLLDIPECTRCDEIGMIANSLEAFRASLASSADANRAALMRGAALEAGSTAMMLTDTAYLITYVNEAMTALLRNHSQAIRRQNPAFDPDRLLGQRADRILSIEPQVVEKLTQSRGETVQHEHHFETGSVVITINPVLDEAGNTVGHVAEWRDVTAEKRTAAVVAAIDLSQARAEFSTKGTLLSANAQFLASMAAEQDRPIGRDFQSILSLEGQPEINLFDLLTKGKPVTGQFRLKRTGSAPAVINGAISPVLDTKGLPQQYVLLGSDVTEAQAERNRVEAQRIAYETSQQAVVEALRAALAQLSEGDLTAVINAEFSLEYEQLRKDYNSAMENLQQAMRGVVENAGAIRSEAGEISTAADDLSRRTEQQAATLEQTAAALNELTASVKSAADVAAQANQMVATAKSNAEVSGTVVREAILAMGEIEESSGKISKITSVIDEIAFQTNLLALNAGVEAARAGEAGRGFAVVASEVRALAQRSSEAAREIAGLISSSNNQVKRGVGLVGQAGEALNGIESSVADIYNFVSEIAVSAREQSSGLAEINIAVNQLDQVTQQNAAMFEETTAASHSLTREAETLSATMAQFRIDQAGAAGAKTGFHSSRAPAPQASVKKQGAPIPLGPAAHKASERSAGIAPRQMGALAIKAAADEQDWEDF